MTSQAQKKFWIRTVITLSVWALLLLLVARVRAQANPVVTLRTFTPLILFVATYLVVHLISLEIFKKFNKKHDTWILGFGLLSGVLIYFSIAIAQGMLSTAPMVPNLIAMALMSISPIWDFWALRE